jgi:hypothetical protein
VSDDVAAENLDLEEYVLRMLDECRDEVKISDSKASIMFGAVAAVLAFMLNVILDPSSQLRTNGDVVVAVATISIVGFFVAFGLLALTVTPRLAPPASGKARYFVEIAAFADAAALADVLEIDARTSVDRHVYQLHVLARIVERKYRRLRTAMWVLAGSMGLLGLAVLIGVAN